MIQARISPENPHANLASYEDTYQSFSWKDVESEFTWRQTGEINIAQEAVDRWAADRDKRDRTAILFEGAGVVSRLSYLELREASWRWANLMVEHGYSLGDRIAILLPPCPDIPVLMIACARLGVVFTLLHHGSCYDDIEYYLTSARPRGIVAHPSLLNRLAADAMTGVEHIFLVEGPAPGRFETEKVVSPALLEEFSKKGSMRWVRGAAPLYVIYNSAAAGPPKGIVHAHQDMVGCLVTARYVLDLAEKTVVWTDSPLGSMSGIVYGVFAPLLCGATSVLLADPFAASTWYRTLERHEIAVWLTSAGVVSRLIEAGEDLPTRYDLSKLRHITSSGTPLTPDQFYWVKKALNRSPHDTWGATEAGMICLANFPSVSIKPGSMGKPVPGVEAAVLDEQGIPQPPLTLGELALKPSWPAMMTGIWNDGSRYQAYFRFRDWFVTGDLVTRDEDGYYYHMGRIDDLVSVEDRMVGPYDIERVLLVHPAVADAAVIAVGLPDGESVFKAYVMLAEGYSPSLKLNHRIHWFVVCSFSPALPLEEIVFVQELPRSRSGELLRRVVRLQDLGLPAGDVTRLKED